MQLVVVDVALEVTTSSAAVATTHIETKSTCMRSTNCRAVSLAKLYPVQNDMSAINVWSKACAEKVRCKKHVTGKEP
jgi:hypothetical protein